MSSKALNWAFRQSLKPMTKAVLVAMADTADDDGYLYPSYEYLIYKTDVSQRKLVDSIKELDETGLIVVEKNYRAGYRLANLFFLMLDNEDMMKPPWAGPVSTKARKAQMEDFRARSKQRRTTTSGISGESSVRHDSGSAHPALTAPADEDQAPEDHRVGEAQPDDTGSATAAPTVGDRHDSGGAGCAPTVGADDENREFAVVQDVRKGGAYVQDLQSVSANPASNPLVEPHDDLSHHQSADASVTPAADGAGSGKAMMIDDSSTEASTHSGVDLKALAVRLESVLGDLSVDRLRWVVDDALSKAKRVSNPLAFVATCVRNDPERFTPVTAGRATVGGGLLTPGEQPCAEPDHGQYRASNCPACRVEARIVDPDAGLEPELSVAEVAAWRKQRAARTDAGSGHRPGGGSSPVPHRVRGA
ncbi:helix-turn-helix domain-containing protein [Arthrobacter pigmenti]